MDAKTVIPGKGRLLAIYLKPSWLSGTLAVGTAIAIVGGTILLTHVGSTVQQSLIGLHHVYDQSSVGTSVQTVAGNFAQNKYLNEVLLFLLWGSVGIVVYSIVQGIIKEVTGAHRLVRGLNYVHADRNRILTDTALRASLRLGALFVFWLLIHWLAYKQVPYAIATSHQIAINLSNVSDWKHCLLAGLVIALSIQGLAVLLRLVMLRVRVLSSTIIM